MIDSMGSASMSQIMQMMQSRPSSAASGQSFDIADTNKDGAVSFEELQSSLGLSNGSVEATSAQDLFANMDKNGDSSVSKEEYKAFQDNALQQLQSLISGDTAIQAQNGTSSGDEASYNSDEEQEESQKSNTSISYQTKISDMMNYLLGLQEVAA